MEEVLGKESDLEPPKARQSFQPREREGLQDKGVLEEKEPTRRL